jgi:hypothetical protein
VAIGVAARADAALSTEAIGRLGDEPDHTFVVVMGVRPGQDRAAIRALNIKSSQTFPEFGIVFVKATGDQVLNWPSHKGVEFVDVLDDREASVVYFLLAQLHRLLFFDNLGVYRPAVVNLSIGPPRRLIGKDASGERAVRKVIDRVVHERGIPVVISVGNDGPQPGLVNGWITPGVIAATATNAAGTELWNQASRFKAPMPRDITMFGAHGIDSIGPRAGCRLKSKEEQEHEEKGGLAGFVGQENQACYELRSGTSFSAGRVSQFPCLIHQALGIVNLKLSSLTAVDTELSVPPYIRAYIDNTFDREHAAFRNRLVDAQQHFGPLQLKISASERKDAWEMLVLSASNVSVRYTPQNLRAFLSRAAKPMAGLAREEIGNGFLSYTNIKDMLTELRYADLVDVLSEGDPQHTKWVERVRQSHNPLVFSEEQIAGMDGYCRNNDLILGLPLFEQPAGSRLANEAQSKAGAAIPPVAERMDGAE